MTKRFAGVEGLRGLAAAGVLLHHVYLYSSPDGRAADLGPLSLIPATSGAAGVVLFFTLSGFLLYRPFAAALLDGTRPPPVRDYLRNRFLRVLPGYWFALLTSGLVLRATYSPPLRAQGTSLASEPSTFAANLFLVQGYHPATLLTGIGPAWSLTVELAFYLSLPLLAATASLLASSTTFGRRRPWLAALAPAGLLLALGQLGWQLAGALPPTVEGSWAGSWHAVVARSFMAQAGLFATGLAVAVLHVQIGRGVVRLPRRWRTGAAVSAALVTAPALFGIWSGLSENYTTLALSFGSACLVGLVVLSGSGGPLARILSSRLLQGAGLVSYGIFLWNEPVVWFLRRHHWTGTGPEGFAVALLLTVAGAGALAAFSWFGVERPAMSPKRDSARARLGAEGS